MFLGHLDCKQYGPRCELMCMRGGGETKVVLHLTDFIFELDDGQSGPRVKTKGVLHI